MTKHVQTVLKLAETNYTGELFKNTFSNALAASFHQLVEAFKLFKPRLAKYEAKCVNLHAQG